MMARAPTGRLASMALAVSVASAIGSIGVAASGRSSTIPPALELPAGGVIFASRDRLAVDRETIRISLDRIEIDYAIRNTTSRPQTFTMTFPLPVIDMANLYGADLVIPAYDPSNPTNFVGLWTTLDGVVVEPDATQRAFALNQVDVTAMLRSHDLPLYPLAPGLSERLVSLPLAARRELEDADVIAVEDGVLAPQWALRTVYHWRHTSAPDVTLALRHHYKPVAGSSPWSEELKAKAVAKYCLDEAQVAALDARAGEGKAPTVYWVHYAPGFNSWLKNPTAQHDIVIDKPEGKGIVATCAAGTRAVSDRQITITARDRVDDSDINVLFVE